MTLSAGREGPGNEFVNIGPHAPFHRGTGLPAATQIVNKPGVPDGVSPESGRWQLVCSETGLYRMQQRHGAFTPHLDPFFRVSAAGQSLPPANQRRFAVRMLIGIFLLV